MTKTGTTTAPSSAPVKASPAHIGVKPVVRRRRRSSRHPRKDLSLVWKAYKQGGDRRLRDQLIEHYLYLVRMIGNRVAARLPRSIDVQDLRSAGVFGLMSAIENYDLERGTPFESYCSTRVRGAILDELRSQDWVPRLVRNRASTYNKAVTQLRKDLCREPSDHEVSLVLGATQDETVKLRRESNMTTVYTLSHQDDRDDDPRILRKLDALMDRDSEAPFSKLVSEDLARSVVGVLNKPQQTVIALYYHERLTMKEIGRVMGISESRVCQIHTKTLERLRDHMQRLADEGNKERQALKNPPPAPQTLFKN